MNATTTKATAAPAHITALLAGCDALRLAIAKNSASIDAARATKFGTRIQRLTKSADKSASAEIRAAKRATRIATSLAKLDARKAKLLDAQAKLSAK